MSNNNDNDWLAYDKYVEKVLSMLSNNLFK